MVSAIDTNVLIAYLAGSEAHSARAQILLKEASKGDLLISPIVYTELYAHPGAKPEDIQAFLKSFRIRIEFNVTEAVWRKAAEKYRAYVFRRRQSQGDMPKRFLADFIVGAQALEVADQLLSFDDAYHASFPELTLIN